ncbi:dolichyl-phosphate-mannose--protein mannosyltransferase [Thermococcus sp. M39]|uniref:dolichyl-phosphate-mannose--protein mannosyltransferase n=1 Tax=Thermococcus sp. M39 TaxID=1638262 RepID=UPI0014394D64|nr:dolichyl-phosphate-mannose--protein mannosyltransferase [Thermococcus sp. M39]NJE08726.1 dolichyl-phosphate-mannose--protein mannosyltransferase [Thermococcus sp. M39]
MGEEMKRREKLYFALLALIIVGTFYYTYKQASSEGLYDYIGDEVWYVSASRNVLHRLGIDVHYINETTGSEGVNIIFLTEPEVKGEVKVSFWRFTILRTYTAAEHLKVPDFVSKLGIKVEYIPFNFSKDYNVDLMKIKVWQIAQKYNYTKYMPYTNFPAVYYEIPKEHFDAFVKDVKSIEGVDVIPGFWYPDKENIQNYLNTEHPFLAKDLIMLGMLIQDKPIFWRLPGLIAHVIINLLVFFAALKITRSYLAAFIALIFSAFDPLLYATSLAAMLDIYVALFTAIFMYVMIVDDYPLSGISIGLAAATKLNGAFPYPILAIKALKDRMNLKRYLLILFVLPGIAFLIPEIPIIMAIGFQRWVEEFIASFSWHLSFKGEHPANSPFWQWFISLKPFPFHYNPDVFAVTDPILMLSMIVFIFAIPYATKKRGKILIPFGIFWSTIAFYALQWVLGGKTQFSFYATPLVPAGAVTLGVMAYELIKWEYFEESLKFYWSWIWRIISPIARLIQKKFIQKTTKAKAEEKEPQEFTSENQGDLAGLSSSESEP